MNYISPLKWIRPLIVIPILSLSLTGCGGGDTEENSAASSDANLSGLTLTGVTLDQLFQPSQMTYSVSVSFLQTSVTLIPVAAHAGTVIRINGTQVASGNTSAAMELAEGLNVIDVEVTAEDGVTTQDYVLSITRGSADTFVQQPYLKGSEAHVLDSFGSSVSISGDALVVGAPGNMNPYRSTATLGAAYVFTRNGGIWSQQPYLLRASNVEWFDAFGASVAISDDTLVVGAPGESSSVNGGEADNSANVAGAAYVFTHSGGVWSKQAYLKASNAEEYDYFGGSVAISGDTLVVGATGEDIMGSGEEANPVSYSGAAYVFTRSDGVWSQQAYLKASNAGANDFFGSSVAISGDTLVVGAVEESSSVSGGEEDESVTDAGAAYVFTRSDGVWSQQAYLKASNAGELDHFGGSVAISGDTLVVGAAGEASSVSGGEEDNSLPRAGAAYIFTRSDGVWSQQAYLKASNAEEFDFFGRSVAISGDTLVVGATGEASGMRSGEEDNSAYEAGAAYVFTRSNGVWSQRAYLKASNAEELDHFGGSVAISGDNTLVVGATGEDSSVIRGEEDNTVSDVGAAYIWQ
jgi:hypothetical protein